MSAKNLRYRAVAVLMLLAGFVVDPSHRGRAAAQQSEQPPAQQELSPEKLDTLLAPVALYPDALLVQVLMCSTSPYQIGAVNAWLSENQDLKGSELQEAAQAEGFDPSFVALVPFRQVLSMLASQMDWARRLGEAFSGERSAVFDSVQRLRAQAKSVGNLKSTSQQEVTTETIQSGQDVIVIQPANPQVIYVPQYNPQVVYTTPPQQTTTTVVVEDDNSDEIAAAAIGFTAGIIVGAATNNYSYWGPYGWYGGAYWHAEAWDDYYDHREDMSEDWYDHREDLAGERSDRVDERQQQRGDGQTARSEGRTERQTSRQDAGATNRTGRQTNRETATATNRSQGRRTSAGASRRSGHSNYEARGYSNNRSSQMSRQRRGSSSGAFSGYGSRSSTRSSSSRGRSSMGSRGGGRRR